MSFTVSGSFPGLAGDIDADILAGKVHGLACAFYVSIDQIELGWWSNCTGLKVDWEMHNFKEGGDASNSPSLALRVKWNDVTLKRGITKAGYKGVRTWLEEVIANPTKSRTAHVTLYDAWAQTVATWSLKSAFPKTWQGPDMDADSKKVAYETLVINHSGFLPHTPTDENP